MMNFNSILLSSENPGKLIAFYADVFGMKSEWGEDEWGGFRVGDGYIIIGPHDRITGKSKEPERFMFNLETDDVGKEFERIKALGAEVIADPYEPIQEEGMTIATFVDPDGNYFQLTTPMK